MTITTVILDLGNVLAFHDNDLLFRKLGERAGLSGAEVEQRILHAPVWEALNRGQIDAAGIRREVQAALGMTLPDDEFDALWSCHFTIHDAVLPLVEALVGRVRLVLLSNTNVLHARWFRPRLPILARFDALLLSHELGLTKPDPAIYREALRRAGVQPHEAAFFDDIAAYVDAANALGIHGRLFTTAAAFRSQLAGLGLTVEWPAAAKTTSPTTRPRPPAPLASDSAADAAGHADHPSSDR